MRLRTVVARLRLEDVRHERLRVAIVEREPRALHLHHDAVAALERVRLVVDVDAALVPGARHIDVAAAAISATLGGRLAPQLFDVSPRDPEVYAAVFVVMGGVAMIALIAPALRASSIDPAVALRQE